MSAHYDAILIGTGFAALSSARQLLARGRKVLLLEARNRIGGRAVTQIQDVEQPIDLGCAQLHGFNEGNPLREVCVELGVKTHIVQGASPPIVVGAQGALAAADGAALLKASGAAAYTPGSPPPPHTASVASLLSPNLPLDVLSLVRLAEIGAGRPLEEVSARHWGFGRPIAGTDAAPIGGYTVLLDKLHLELESKGALFKLSAEVVKVEDLGAEGVKVSIKTGETYTASTVVSTCPLGVLRVAPPKFSPELPTPFTAALQRTLNGSLEKVILLYDEPWWPSPSETPAYFVLPLVSRDNAEPPSTLLEQFSQSTLLVQNSLRNAPIPHPTLTIYVSTFCAEFIGNYAESEIQTALHDYLADRLNVPDAPKPKKVLVTRWCADPFSRGETSAPTTLTKSDDGELGTPLDYVTLSRSQWEGRLGFAGEHTVLDGRGSVAGAWLSGEREGKRVNHLLDRLSKL